MKMTTNKVLAALLLVSVIGNLLLGGFVVGRWSMGGHGGPGMMHSGQWGERHSGLARVIKDDESRKKLKTLWRDGRDQVRPHMQATAKSRKALNAALSAEPYDREAFKVALDGMRDEMGGIMDEVHGVLLNAADQLSAEERQAIAQWAERHHGRKWGEGRRGGFWRRLFAEGAPPSDK